MSKLGKLILFIRATAGRVSSLESPHVTRVAGVFQTVLVALQEELEEEPERREKENALQISEISPIYGRRINIKIRYKKSMGSH